MTEEFIYGLLEGEGCFGIRKASSPRRNGNTYRTPEISLAMADSDVVEQVALSWGTAVTTRWDRIATHRRMFRTRLTGVRAAAVMVSAFSRMGARRRSKIEECLAHWEHSHKPRTGGQRFWRT